MPSKLPSAYAFIDTETTGINSQKDRVIEIGIIRVENGEITDTFDSLVNPQVYISPYIAQITGINPDLLNAAPLFSEIYRRVKELVDGCLFVAHNARFDYSFIRSEFKRLDQDFTAPLLCTVKLSRRLFPQHRSHNLDSIINRFQLTVPRRHRAFDDARAIYDFFNLVSASTPPDVLSHTLTRLLQKPALPPYLDHDVVNRLPESPGVYIFYGDSQTPLYVGKSKNIRSRCLSHFQSDLTSPREMKLSQTVRAVKAIPTAGELGALLLESTLIKQLLPLYNRLLRASRKFYILKQTTSPAGYYSVTLDTADQLDASSLNQIIAIFRSKKQASVFLEAIAKQHRLCPKILGLDNSRQACFSYHLGLCQGACIGQENSAIYNLRFLLAFSKHRPAPWPYPGAVVITESDPVSGLIQHHLIDQWLHLGTFDTDSVPTSWLFPSSSLPSFDWDTYKILKRYFDRPTPGSSLKPLDPSTPSFFNPTQF